MTPSGAARVLATLLLARCFDLAAADDCRRETFRLRSQADADALKDCTTLTGSVVIATSAEGTIHLDGVERIVGDFSTDSCSGTDDRCNDVTALNFDALTEITQGLSLQSAPSLSTASFQNLKTVGGNVIVEDSPELSRLNLTNLVSAGSIYLRHNQKLTDLDLPRVSNITGDDPTIEIVNLGISEWPAIRIRARYDDPGPRRLDRLVARDLPNISRFAFDSADIIGTLEAHGLPHQTAALSIDVNRQSNGFLEWNRWQNPGKTIKNLTLAGFGGNFTVDNSDWKMEVNSLTITNTAMYYASLYSVTGLERLHVEDNSNMSFFHMSPDLMKHNLTEAVIFRNNPLLTFRSQMSGWHWGFNTSSFILQGSPISPSWIQQGGYGVSDELVIESSDNSERVCEAVVKHVQGKYLRAPEDGYSCGGSQYSSDDGSAASAKRDILPRVFTLTCIGCLYIYGAFL